MRNIVLWGAVVVILLSGCTAQKRVTQPNLNTPNEFGMGMEQDSLSIADMSWMELLGDPILNDLIEQTLQHNKDILIASARITEFERKHRITRSGQFPTVGMEGYLDHETTTTTDGSTKIEDELSLTANLSWELDLFGRLRWANRGALYDYLQTEEARRALEMTLIAEVATSYFELLALDTELSIVENTLSTRRENVGKAKLRFEGGLTSEIPYQQAQVELARTASLLPDLQLKIRIKENEIAYLAGRYPSSVERAMREPEAISEDMLKLGLPSELIARRPDIREAELAYKSASAKVGVEWANRFPRFTFGLEGGFEFAQFDGFFTAPWSYAVANMTTPLFSFGRRKAQYEAAIAACEAKCYAYEKRVLVAFHEVSNAVEAYRAAMENTRLMEHLKNSSRKYVDLALVQYLNGQINYIDVLDAQRSYFNAEIDHSDAIRDQYLALINLYKALGGGWN